MLMGSDLPFRYAVRDHGDALRDPRRAVRAVVAEARAPRSDAPRGSDRFRAGTRRPAHA